MDNVYKIYSGDYSKDGYDQGISDRKESRPKNKFKFFTAVSPINYVWAFNNAFDSFNKNYDKGYLDGQRVEHNVYSSSNQTKGISMQEDSFENHIKMLQSFQQNLVATKQHLDIMRNKYKNQIQSMGKSGFVTNIVTPLLQKYQVLSSKINEVDMQLESHNQKINMQIEALDALRAIARMN